MKSVLLPCYRAPHLSMLFLRTSSALHPFFIASYYSTMLIYFLASLLSGSLLTLFKCAFHFLPFHLFTLNPSSIFITTVDLVCGKRLRRKLQQGVSATTNQNKKISCNNRQHRNTSSRRQCILKEPKGAVYLV